MKGKYEAPEPRLLFGQFLLEKGKITSEVLQKALQKQQEEGESSTVRESHRYLGQILLDDFQVFENRVELNHYIVNFKKYRDKIEEQHAELKNLSGKHI
jgi:hypothetical protein